MRANHAITTLITAAALLWAPLAGAETVTVEGEWGISGDDVASAKDKAIEVALRRAVEQQAGTMVASETLIEDFQLKMDSILTMSKGFVKKYEIIDQKKADNVYIVKIKAEVSDDKMEDEMIKQGIILSRLGFPRAFLLVSEQSVGQAAPSIGVGATVAATDIRICENTLIDQLKPFGFDFVDHQALAGKVTSTDAMSIITGGNASKMREIANLTDAEIIIAGKCIAKDAGPIAGTKMHSAQANITVRVFNTDDGKILATADSHAASPHIDPQTGGVKALKSATKKMGKDLTGKLMTEWQRYVFGTRSVTVKVSKGASHKSIKALKAHFKYNIRGVQNVNVRRAVYKKGTAEMNVMVKGTVGMLADELSEKEADGVKVEILELTSNTLEIEVK